MSLHAPTSCDCPLPAPRKQVLLLTCIDPRLLDDVVRYMNTLNLHNRYDHVVFAGAALGVRRLCSPLPRDANGALTHEVDPSANPEHPKSSWWQVFVDQLQIAVELHQIRDVYILEHRHCGAYKGFYPEEEYRRDFGDSEEEQQLEEDLHKIEAFALAKEIREYCEVERNRVLSRLSENSTQTEIEQANKAAEAWDITVRSLFMDLLGNVKHWCDEANCTKTKSSGKSKGGKKSGKKK